MRVRVGIENHNDDRSIAWALEHPGCFAYGADAAEAQSAMQAAVRDYARWVHQHGMAWMDDPSLEVVLGETFDAYFVPRDVALAYGHDEPYMIESFFRFDAEPLSGIDVERALRMLDWSRQDLRSAIHGLSLAQLERTYPGERWSINGILLHIGGAEWWYQSCLGSRFPAHEEELSADPLERIELVRAHFLVFLAKQVDVRYLINVEGEDWSPRKVLRRALWHERDHTGHIRKLLNAVASG